jgi:hypothetical protein
MTQFRRRVSVYQSEPTEGKSDDRSKTVPAHTEGLYKWRHTSDRSRPEH